jgi:cell wall-associated NlpC family hydrolase
MNRPFARPILLVAPALLFLAGPANAQYVGGAAPEQDSSNTLPAVVPATPVPAADANQVSYVDLSEPQVITYTVVKGDSLTKIARKYNTTRRKLETLNGLPSSKIKPGQILVVGETKHPKAKTSLAAKEKPHHYLAAQPVQDFDVPAATFASCPVPLPADDDTPAPVAAPATAEQAPAPAEVATESPAPVAVPQASPAPEISAAPPVAEPAGNDTTYTAPIAPVPVQPVHRGFFGLFSAPPAATTTDWRMRFLQAARDLGDRGLDYDDDWRPPGESHAWTMDCSNTARYLYRVTAGIQLPRTASDQYYYLHLQDKAWDVPQAANGFADCNYLRQNLKPGDLLFWENTYRPERQPPITHVMIFLGTNERGEWIMAGSQTGPGGEHNRRHGGPDVYVFNPTRPCGGYTTWLGLVHHQGRFCAYGRPLEADPAKLAVAAND